MITDVNLKSSIFFVRISFCLRKPQAEYFTAYTKSWSGALYSRGWKQIEKQS